MMLRRTDHLIFIKTYSSHQLPDRYLPPSDKWNREDLMWFDEFFLRQGSIDLKKYLPVLFAGAVESGNEFLYGSHFSTNTPLACLFPGAVH